MNLKKGDLIKLKKQKKEIKKAYLVLSIKKDKNIIITSRIDFEVNNQKWNLNILNRGDSLYIKYDSFSVFNVDDIYKLEYELDNKILIVEKIYELHNMNLHLFKQQQKLKSRRTKLAKQKKKSLVSSTSRTRTIPSNKSIKGINDLNYKGHITIVRG